MLNTSLEASLTDLTAESDSTQDTSGPNERILNFLAMAISSRCCNGLDFFLPFSFFLASEASLSWVTFQ